ncbi:MAG: hypothetical protein DWQ07_15700 [Chloroflexi bacterium]|nr:MAG: hypothetical protein DWQ07_15700 [Chloroflexota bacterium]MBL1195195.1 hypothetical protein [Chloroflexota bacterium]NOH12480.1 hypothetical protein [Chloroflexota bacterium]
MAKEKKTRYVSYLLRCWEERDDEADKGLWRFSLEDPRSGQRKGFTTLVDLMNVLEKDLKNN